MISVDDFSQFTESALELVLVPDESNYVEESSMLDFTWEAVSFEERFMVI